jgi:NAD(P)-dependent dehydrogenase (short-subunit alcohol dehydrogenase family)
MEAVVARAVEVFGQLDILVNNAGVGRFGQVDEMSIEDWKTVLETNLSGVFFACHAAIPVLRRGGGGWIVNIGSLAGSHPFVGGSAYCASKAGLDALSDVLMQEVRHDNIRVSCVAPGSVSTRFGGGAAEAEPTAWKLAAGDVSRMVVDLLRHNPRSLPSRVEIRPSRPRR